MSSSQWLKKITNTFTIDPRDKTERPKTWISRTNEEKECKKALSMGQHLCIDGPSGTGKSSLALTVLSESKVKYVPLQITQRMTWSSFCKNLVRKPIAKKRSSVGVGFEGGIQQGLPLGKFQVSLLRETNERSAEEIAQNWDEHDLCKQLAKDGVSLLIDDFERANQDIVTSISDVAKLLTQNYRDADIKLLIVGTDDIYNRLLNANYSLQGRVREVSLGTFQDRNASWTYLLKGWEALNLPHPANSKFPSENEEVQNCINSIYEAADGLPKSLTELAWEITKDSRNGVAANTIKSTCQRLLKQKARNYQRQFPELLDLIQHEKAVRMVIRYMLQNGSGKIHYWNDLVLSLGDSITEEEIQTAIDILIDQNTITQTGYQNHVLFFRDLVFAHTLGVIAHNPQKYGIRSKSFAPLSQLSLGF